MPEIRRSVIDRIPPRTLYAILKLRSEVFVVEQDCVYLDLDDRDLEPEAEHMWMEDEGRVVATLRVLRDPNGDRRIGRVVTAASVRGKGSGGLMIDAALEAETGEVVLDAQSQLVDWYARWGFVVDGEEFTEDSILHTPMRRRATNPL
jgi:ElaA protein